MIPPESVLDIPRQRLLQGEGWICTVTGKVRGSPPVDGIALAFGVDPTFTGDRIHFSTETLLAALQDSTPGQVHYLEDLIPCGCYDRVLSPAPFQRFLATVRKTGVGLVISVNAEDFQLETRVRRDRSTALLRVDPPRGLGGPGPLLKWFEVSDAGKTFGPPVVNGGPLQFVAVCLPPKDLHLAYLAKRRACLVALLQRIFGEGSPRNIEPAAPGEVPDGTDR